MVFMWLVYGMWCLVLDYNIAKPKQETAKAEAEWVDTYPKVIGLIEPAKAQDDLFVKYFGELAPTMKAIAKAESGMNDKAISEPNRNGTVDYGILQVNSIHADHVGGDVNKLLDLETNLRVSKEILDSQGLSAWTCWKNGSFKKYL